MVKQVVKKFMELTVAGTKKYVVMPGFVEKFAAMKTIEKKQFTDSDPSMPSRAAFRKHPFNLGLPPLSISDQLDRAAVDYLREHSVHSLANLRRLSAILVSTLHGRELLSEKQIIEKMQQRTQNAQENNETENGNGDDGITKVMRFHDDQSFSGSNREGRQSYQHALATWKSISYSKLNSELYLVGRLGPNFAVACRVLYEIRKRCPLFVPHSFFDFASGLGTYAWAANSVWPIGCITEHHLVEASQHMTLISEFLLKNRDLKGSVEEDVFPGVRHRRFMPAANVTSDLVMSGYALVELAGEKDRRRVVENLWNRTTGFLVLIEEGTKAGHAALLEARDWLISEGGDDMHIFAPCPHRESCGLAGLCCSSLVRYFNFGLTKDPAYPNQERFSYLIVSRDDWRKFGQKEGQEVVVADPEQEPHPRIISQEPGGGGPSLDIDLCLPNGDCERVTFSKSGTDRSLYFFLKNASSGDIAPCQRLDSSELTKPDEEPQKTSA